MKISLKIILISILVSLLSYKFFFNKWLGYESIPNTHIFDEHDYPFVGYSFRTTGVPTGWSTMNAYQELDDLHPNQEKIGFNGISITASDKTPNIKNKNLFDYPVTKIIDVDIGKGTETIRVVQPFFDHPIIGSLILSLGIKEAKSFDSISPSEYRQVSLVLSVITGILIFIFTQLVFKKYIVSFLSLIIYSTVPEYILMSRFALLENILIPFSLCIFSLIIFSNTKKGRLRKLIWVSSGILCGLAFLVKESGIFIFISGLFLMKINQKNIKEILLCYLIPFTLISIVYYVYMYYLSPSLFFKLLFDQANREWFGPLSFFHQITQPNFSLFPKSGYWLFGIISLFILSYKNYQKYQPVLIPFVTYLLVYIFMGGLNYPWYYLPFLPFIIISSSVMIYQIITRPNIPNFTLFYLLIFSSSFFWGYFVFHTNQSNYLLFRMSLLVFSFIFIFRYLSKTKLSKFIWIIFFTITLYQIYNWNNQGFQYIISHWGNLPEKFSFPL